MHWLNEHDLILVQKVLLFEPWRYRAKDLLKEGMSGKATLV